MICIYVVPSPLSAFLIARFITALQYWCCSSSKSSLRPTLCRVEEKCKWGCKLVNTSLWKPVSWSSAEDNHIPPLTETIWLIAPQIIYIQTTTLGVHSAQREGKNQRCRVSRLTDKYKRSRNQRIFNPFITDFLRFHNIKDAPLLFQSPHCLKLQGLGIILFGKLCAKISVSVNVTAWMWDSVSVLVCSQTVKRSMCS